MLYAEANIFDPLLFSWRNFDDSHIGISMSRIFTSLNRPLGGPICIGSLGVTVQSNANSALPETLLSVWPLVAAAF
jgi:hypothetical protein